MNHTTVSVSETVEPNAIVLVGSPASGKTTLRNLFSDHGVVGCNLITPDENGELSVDDDWRALIGKTFSDASNEAPHVACIEGATSEQHISYIEENVDETLVIRVHVPDTEERIARHREREVGANNDVLTDAEIVEIETEALRRERTEMPYPEHDVTIINDDATSTAELSNRCASIVSLLSSVERTTVE